MKRISGKVVSTKPISLSDAAKSLTKFAASDQGASHSVSFFIHHAALSFNQLVHTLTPNPLNFTQKLEEFSLISHKAVDTLVKNEAVDIGQGHKEKSEKNDDEEVKDDDGIDTKKKKNRGVGENEGDVEKVKEDLVVKEDGERKESKSVDRDASENDGSTEQSKKKKSKKRRIEGDK